MTRQTNKMRHGTDLEIWAEEAHTLSKLRDAIDHARQFLKNASRNLSASDRVELAKCTARNEAIFMHQWEKLIKKIRGLK